MASAYPRNDDDRPTRRFVIRDDDIPYTAQDAIEADGLPSMGDEWKPYGLFCVSKRVAPPQNMIGERWVVICVYDIKAI